MYEVFLTDEAQKQLAKIDKRYQKAIAFALIRLGNNPDLGDPLKYDLKGEFRLRVSRYRIVYEINHAEKKILILIIEHRKDVYR
jgi:mRNA interferase RelE/StbE